MKILQDRLIEIDKELERYENNIRILKGKIENLTAEKNEIIDSLKMPDVKNNIENAVTILKETAIIKDINLMKDSINKAVNILSRNREVI